jgi:hypothetical protein
MGRDYRVTFHATLPLSEAVADAFVFPTDHFRHPIDHFSHLAGGGMEAHDGAAHMAGHQGGGHQDSHQSTSFHDVFVTTEWCWKTPVEWHHVPLI